MYMIKLLDFSFPANWPEKKTNLTLKNRCQRKGGILGDNSSQRFEFKVIPYYAWSHRGMGEMAVWFSLAYRYLEK